MRVRAAVGERDGAACAAIYAPYVDGSPTSFEELVPDALDMAERIERVWRVHPWLVAEIDGQVAGFAYATGHRARPAYRWAAETSIYLAAARRGRGVGRALYGELIGRLREQRLHVACAGITLPNAASVALHAALGFEQVGVYRRIGYKHGGWRDVAWWQLELRPADGGPPEEPLPPRRDGKG